MLAKHFLHMCTVDLPIVFQLVREFILEFSPPDRRAPSSIREWVSRLDHKLCDDTMEYNAFKVPTSCVTHKVLDCLRHVVGEQSEVDVSHRRVDNGRVGERGWTTFVSCSGSCDGLFFASRLFVEDISVVEFAVPEESHQSWSTMHDMLFDILWF